MSEFISLCGLKKGPFGIEHNLEFWRLSLLDVKQEENIMKLEISVPYGEMSLSVVITNNDLGFFGKNTTRLYLTTNDVKSSIINYIKGGLVLIDVPKDTKYLLFDSPYFYPHNRYYISNKDYLYGKICNSVTYLRDFVTAYKSIFDKGNPIIYFKDAVETQNEYILSLILRCITTILYVQTDTNENCIHFHVIINTKVKPDIYHNVELKIPRIIRDGVIKFKFSGATV